jgi:fructokinase
MYLPREAEDAFSGSCRFHGGCLQGLASGKALAERWGMAAEALPPTHPAWDLEARYLARACANLIYSFAPERIVLGSSVGSAPQLVERINAYLSEMLNGFLEPGLRDRFSHEPPVVRAALMPESSLIGAALMATGKGGLDFNR